MWDDSCGRVVVSYICIKTPTKQYCQPSENVTTSLIHLSFHVLSIMATQFGGPLLLFQTLSRRHLAACDSSSLWPAGQENYSHLWRTEESPALLLETRRSTSMPSLIGKETTNTMSGNLIEKVHVSQCKCRYFCLVEMCWNIMFCFVQLLNLWQSFYTRGREH